MWKILKTLSTKFQHKTKGNKEHRTKGSMEKQKWFYMCFIDWVHVYVFQMFLSLAGLSTLFYSNSLYTVLPPSVMFLWRLTASTTPFTIESRNVCPIPVFIVSYNSTMNQSETKKTKRYKHLQKQTLQFVAPAIISYCMQMMSFFI